MTSAPSRHSGGYSLVEVSLALGLMAIIITSLIALLPLGVQSTRETAQEARGINLLTLAEAELRNSRTANGLTPRFGLPTPYVFDASDRKAVNPQLVTDRVYTVAVREDGMAEAPGAQYPHQITLVYTHIPAAGTMAPLQARLVASWPAQSGSVTADSVTDLRKVSGYLETHLIFSGP